MNAFKKSRFSCGRISWDNDLCGIGEWEGVKQAFNIVKTVVPFGNYPQAEVDLRIGKTYQTGLIEMGGGSQFLSSVDLIPDGDSPEIVFLFKHFIEQIVQFFNAERVEIVTSLVGFGGYSFPGNLLFTR